MNYRHTGNLLTDSSQVVRLLGRSKVGEERSLLSYSSFVYVRETSVLIWHSGVSK